MPDDGPADGERTRRTIRDRLLQFVNGAGVPKPSEAAAPQAPSAPTGDFGVRLRTFERASVRDVMISRVDIASIEVNATLGETLNLFAREAHSRMPVYEESLDKALGFVHIKDVVAEIAKVGMSDASLAAKPLQRLSRTILFVPESMRLPDLLKHMQATRIHMALVIDEFGGTAGLVSLEDLVEQIVGDIEDEHDEDAPLIFRRGRNAWEADGLADITDFERATSLVFMVPEFRDEISTVGGLATALAGRVPKAGDQILHPGGYLLDVVAADPRRVTRLRVRPAPARTAARELAAGDPGAIERGVDTSG
jgi:CBS domain containing-hemolysin-like protein